MDILDQLKTPFAPKEIHWRIGRKSKKGDTATALAYLDARNVMKRLDGVLGVSGWQDKYKVEPPRTVRKYCKKLNAYYNEQICGRVICELSIKVGDEWITKCDGAGETNVEGEKGAISDAFKRAAVKFGVGRYLYYLDSFYYPIDNYGNFTSAPNLPKWALPKELK
ncbi:Rad52/Rad22 family DNA repair protein [Pseudoalteromonas marina]|uniref:Rad52/Rad22 family DNA repair protein n=1 Tax=Pseudoalteromonas marina TaxID=267375 RepID=UPI003C51F443